MVKSGKFGVHVCVFHPKVKDAGLRADAVLLGLTVAEGFGIFTMADLLAYPTESSP